LDFFQVEFVVVVLQNTLILNFFLKNEELFERRFANHTSLGCYHVYFLSASCWFSRASKQAQSGTFL